MEHPSNPFSFAIPTKSSSLLIANGRESIINNTSNDLINDQFADTLQRLDMENQNIMEIIMHNDMANTDEQLFQTHDPQPRRNYQTKEPHPSEEENEAPRTENDQNAKSLREVIQELNEENYQLKSQNKDLKEQIQALNEKIQYLEEEKYILLDSQKKSKVSSDLLKSTNVELEKKILQMINEMRITLQKLMKRNSLIDDLKTSNSNLSNGLLKMANSFNSQATILTNIVSAQRNHFLTSNLSLNLRVKESKEKIKELDERNQKQIEQMTEEYDSSVKSLVLKNENLEYVLAEFIQQKKHLEDEVTRLSCFNDEILGILNSYEKKYKEFVKQRNSDNKWIYLLQNKVNTQEMKLKELLEKEERMKVKMKICKIKNQKQIISLQNQIKLQNMDHSETYIQLIKLKSSYEMQSDFLTKIVIGNVPVPMI